MCPESLAREKSPLKKMWEGKRKRTLLVSNLTILIT